MYARQSDTVKATAVRHPCRCSLLRLGVFHEHISKPSLLALEGLFQVGTFMKNKNKNKNMMMMRGTFHHAACRLVNIAYRHPLQRRRMQPTSHRRTDLNVLLHRLLHLVIYFFSNFDIRSRGIAMQNERVECDVARSRNHRSATSDDLRAAFPPLASCHFAKVATGSRSERRGSFLELERR